MIAGPRNWIGDGSWTTGSPGRQGKLTHLILARARRQARDFKAMAARTPGRKMVFSVRPPWMGATATRIASRTTLMKSTQRMKDIRAATPDSPWPSPRIGRGFRPGNPGACLPFRKAGIGVAEVDSLAGP